MVYRALRIFSGASHLIYGILALVDPFYKEEFVRFGFSDYRILIAVTQSLAGGALLLGFYRFRFTQYSSALLAVMMTGAFITRLVIHDDLLQSTPAFVYMFLNSLIFIKSIKTRK